MTVFPDPLLLVLSFIFYVFKCNSSGYVCGSLSSSFAVGLLIHLGKCLICLVCLQLSPEHVVMVDGLI